MRVSRRHALSAGLSLLAAAAAPRADAHGGHHHVLGTVKAVDAPGGRLEVTTRDGKVVTLVLTDKTKYLKGAAAAAAADLVVGQRVVVDARKDGQALVALEVRLGATAPPAAERK